MPQKRQGAGGREQGEFFKQASKGENVTHTDMTIGDAYGYPGSTAFQAKSAQLLE